MTLVLGVDVGGTSTRAAIADGEGNVLGAATGAGGNIDDVGPSAAAAAIATAARLARERAGIGDAAVDAAFLGIAGVVSAADREAVRSAIAPLGVAPPERVQVDHDCRIALAGGLSGRPGVVLIAGTGSAAFGVDPSGQAWRSGGWGALLGDEGSGYSVAVDALRAVVRAVDGRGPATALRAELLAALSVEHPDGLMHRLHVEGRDRAQIASLAPLVVGAAERGDEVARAVLDDAAEQLALMVDAVCGSLRFEAPVEVACVGGLLESGDPVQARLRAELGRLGRDVRLVGPELPPVLGACLLALQALGRADAGVARRLGGSLSPVAAPPSGAAPAGA